VSVLARRNPAPEGGIFVRFTPVGAFEFHNCLGKPENLGWLVLQSQVVSSPDYSTDERYAIVTDSDLGNHTAFNDRSKPIFGESFLALNIDLIYASADVTRGALNEMVKSCDRVASRLKEALAEAPFWPDFQRPAVAHSRGCRARALFRCRVYSDRLPLPDHGSRLVRTERGRVMVVTTTGFRSSRAIRAPGHRLRGVLRP
jgi:hypothetical protein